MFVKRKIQELQEIQKKNTIFSKSKIYVWSQKNIKEFLEEYRVYYRWLLVRRSMNTIALHFTKPQEIPALTVADLNKILKIYRKNSLIEIEDE